MDYAYRITTHGRAVMAACLAMEKPFLVTRAAFGAGKAEEDAELADMHQLLEYVCEGAVAERKHQDDRLTLTLQYTNREHPEAPAFLLSEFMLFGEDPETGEETDLLYGTLGDYRQPVPAYNPDYPPSVFNFPLTLILSSELQTVVSAPAGLVAWDELEELAQALKSPLGLGFRLKIRFDPGFRGKPYTVEGPDGEAYTGTVPEGLEEIIPVRRGNAVYAVSSKIGSNTFTVRVAVGAEEETCRAELRGFRVYGASWDGMPGTKWTRTDDAEDFTDPVPYVAGATEYGSPFDNIRPWSGMVKKERTGGTMVEIPKFWYQLKPNWGNGGRGIDIRITNAWTEEFAVSPAHMARGDGKGERNAVYIGRYHCGSAWKSVTGQVPKVNVTRDTARTEIHKLGSNIWQSDFAMRFTIWLLYLVEFADWDSQKVIGKGCGDIPKAEFSENMDAPGKAMGYTDGMPYHTGTTKASRDEHGLGTQYRNIEGLWDNAFDWCDGCVAQKAGMYLILNPNEFSDSAGGNWVTMYSPAYPYAFRVAEEGDFPLFAPIGGDMQTTPYTSDSWNTGLDNGSPAVSAGGMGVESGYYGLFCIGSTSAAKGNQFTGARIQELP